MQRVAIISYTLMVILGFLILSQMYFSYTEANEISDNCYNIDGFPTIERSGLSIDYFNCDMN